MPLDAIRSLLKPELNAVNATILSYLESNVPLIQEVGSYLIESGGKRVRPLVALLTAKACSYTGTEHITLAAIIEYLHTATLLHDDVVDDSEQRRGRPTANLIWDNATSVLVGDFLYSRAFQMIVSLKCIKMMRVLSEASNMIVEGEVAQLINKHNPDYTEEQYFHVIYCKTAKLFEASSHLGAMLSKVSPDIERSMQAYGKHIGMAFQLVDDVLDYTAVAEELGKNLGDDLAEGKVTLPLLYALKHAKESDKRLITQAIQTGQRAALQEIQVAIAASGAIEYTMSVAKLEVEKAKQALTQLPPSPYRDALSTLADFTISRSA